MKHRSPGAEFTPARRRFLGQLTAVSAVLTGPKFLRGAMRKEILAPDAGQAAQTLNWSPKAGPLMTRWSSLVDPRLPHPLYPRPQLVRSEWLNLNGQWEYQQGTGTDEQPPFGKSLTGTILVPYPVESALSGVLEHHDRLWYRRSLAIPAAW